MLEPIIWAESIHLATLGARGSAQTLDAHDQERLLVVTSGKRGDIGKHIDSFAAEALFDLK